MKFNGYVRPDGRIGIRNYILILPSVICSSETCNQIAEQVEGAISLPNQAGCAQVGDDVNQTRRTLIGFGNNPNVAGVLVVGLGCEGVNPRGVAKEIEKSGKPVETLVIQETGGTVKTIEKGIELAKKLKAYADQAPRKEVGLNELTVGIERGDSDITSAVAADPASGAAADLLVEQGGTVLFSETKELIGAEHLLAEKAASSEVAQAITAAIEQREEKLKESGVDYRSAQPGPKHIQKGFSTIEEKALAAAFKSGTSPIQDVLRYGDAPKTKGRVFMDSGGFDIESVTGMVAGGAQLIVYTTGKGNPVGSPISPVIKVCGDPKMAQVMADNIDINAGRIMTGEETIADVGRRIYREMIEVANGKLTKAEQLGFADFAIHRILPSF